MDWFSKVVFLSCLILLLIVPGGLGDEEEVEGGQEGQGGHRHRHRHRSSSEVEDGGDNVEMEGGNGTVVGMGQFETSNSTAVFSGTSLERRLASLEEEVRYLCMEDEEDVDRRIRHLGVKCICPQTEAPVCGSDNVTYFNRCFLHCHAKHALLNYHRYRITLKYFGRCGHAI